MNETCAVERCGEPTFGTVKVNATATVYQPLPYVLQEVPMDVPLCRSHFDLLTVDAMKGLSVG